MKIGITSLGMQGIELPKALATMVVLGAECIELNGRPGVHPDLTWAREDYPRVKKLLREASLEATSLGGYNDFAQLDDEALEAQINQLVSYCQRAADLEIPIVRAFGGDTKPGHTIEELRPRIVRGLVETLERTESLRVRIGLENHGRLTNDGDLIKGILDEIKSPRLGLTLDTGNFAWAGHSRADVEKFFMSLIPYVISVHVKDGRWGRDSFEFVPAGEGDLDLGLVLAALAGRGYEGPVYSEFEGKGDYFVGTERSMRFLHRLRKKVV